MDLTNKGKYMRCCPADRDQEVTNDIIDSAEYSLYFQAGFSLVFFDISSVTRCKNWDGLPVILASIR